MNKHLKKKAIYLSDEVKYYEQPKGLLITYDTFCPVCGCDMDSQYLIHWRKIKAALKRKEQGE